MGDRIVVDVANDFSRTPGGRYRTDGRWSGQEFREDKLQPLLDRGDDIVVDLDGPEGFTASFLEEVFGGLVRNYGPRIMERVTIQAARRASRGRRAAEFVQRALSQLGSQP